MSTNKTPNYNLHSWLPQDEFHVSEINENFTAIDTLISQRVELVMGNYTGTGENNRAISVGRTPVAVHIERVDGARNLNACYGGLFFPQEDGSLLPREDGFIIQWGSGLNAKNVSFVYMAFFTV